jgi:hypothetical protein
MRSSRVALVASTPAAPATATELSSAVACFVSLLGLMSTAAEPVFASCLANLLSLRISLAFRQHGFSGSAPSPACILLTPEAVTTPSFVDLQHQNTLKQFQQY